MGIFTNPNEMAPFQIDFTNPCFVRLYETELKGQYTSKNKSVPFFNAARIYTTSLLIVAFRAIGAHKLMLPGNTGFRRR